MLPNSAMVLRGGLWVPEPYADVPLSPAVRAVRRMRMALPNDSSTAGDGATIATHLVNGKEYQVVMLAHESGHLHDTIPTYYFWRTYTAGANLQRTIDIFNAAGSGVVVRVKKLFLHHNQAAVTGVAHTFDVIRTTAVGTSGTAITGRKANSANPAIPAQVTCRFNATGGATEDFTWFGIAVDTEETRPGTALAPMINWIPEGLAIQELELPEGEGLLVKQTTNSTVGVWGCLLVVTIE
ncbi:MAG: hypothetical protein WD825_17270 [Gemmatimonadaceae bacterium]